MHGFAADRIEINYIMLIYIKPSAKNIEINLITSSVASLEQNNQKKNREKIN